MTITTSIHHSFHTKLLGAFVLVGLAQFLFYGQEAGWTLGGFALAWTIVLLLTRADVRASRPARVAVAIATLFGVMMVDDPGPLKWLLFGASIGMATLLPLRPFDDALHWAGRLVVHGFGSIVAPLRDAGRFARARRRRPGRRMVAVATMLVLPVLGSALFLTLFAQANPVIEQAFAAIRFPDLSDIIYRTLFSLFFLVMIWSSLRPRRTLLPQGFMATPGKGPLLSIGRHTLILSLVTFNLIFAGQNALDLAFLWSGAPLPQGVTLADYAHRGAYPLIVTALLAGGFVLLAGRSRDRLVRRLIVLWVAQNLLLVASSILRTVDYIAVFGLSGWRIAALAWMGLVALGLVLIVWRMLRGRSVRWLINANALAAGAVLTAGCASDLGEIAARWNVAHAKSAADIDLCYFESLGPSALLSLIEVERRASGPVLRYRARNIIGDVMADMRRDRADWRRWSWRNARRLSAAEALVGQRKPAAKPHFCGEPYREQASAPALTKPHQS